MLERNHCASNSRAKMFFESSGYKIERGNFSVAARLKIRHMLISTAEETSGQFQLSSRAWFTRTFESLFMRASNAVAARAALRCSPTQAG
jgi:hypothetical protein